MRQTFPGKDRCFRCRAERYDNDVDFALCMRKDGIPREYEIPVANADGSHDGETETPPLEAYYCLWEQSNTYQEIKQRIREGEILASVASVEPVIELPSADSMMRDMSIILARGPSLRKIL